MKNQMQNKTYILLDVFNMISRCLIVFLLYAYVFKISGGTIKGVDYTTTLWSMFIYFCIMILNLRKIDQLILDDVKSGNVELFMNKPISYLSIAFYKVIGQGLYSFLIIRFHSSLFGQAQNKDEDSRLLCNFIYSTRRIGNFYHF
jgi:hypothetical protein